ncbi:hypothetical protein [Streptomyces rhizosphaericus]|uniref:hypothetical protein n=1 Tax=Streptomyces rhizosphaericus TaxID=114699 RepID=UPI00117FF316|nr:hypothetical protein [Streptomyces rhizosphaericus]
MRAKIAGIGFAVILVAAIMMANFTGGDSGGTPGRDADSPVSGSGPTPGGSGGDVSAGGSANGIPVRYPRSRNGATAAAVNYEIARSSPSYFTSRGFRHSVLDTIMATDAVNSQKKADDRDAKQLEARLGLDQGDGSRMVMRAAPMGTRVSSYSPEVATIQVWMSEIVGMTSSDSPVPVSASWSTYTLTLQWQKSDWKLAVISQEGGPTPLQTSDAAPDSVRTFEKMERDFHAPPYIG